MGPVPSFDGIMPSLQPRPVQALVNHIFENSNIIPQNTVKLFLTHSHIFLKFLF